MNRELGFVKFAADAMTPLPGLPLIEICGQSRMLIENHRGIAGYGSCEIQINVCHGCVVVNGENLKVTNMCKDKLVITGRIHTVNLRGRG